MKWLTFAPLLLLTAVAACADPPTPDPPKPGVPTVVKPGGFADVTVPVPKGASVLLRYEPQPVQIARDLPPGRIVFGGEAGKSYTVTITVIDFESKSATQTDYPFVFTGPTPPVPPGPGPNPPGPGPNPPPTPTDVPFKGVTGLHILIVFDNANQNNLPPGQQEIIYSQDNRIFMDSVTPVGPDGKQHQWRIWDKNEAVSSAEQVWQDAMKRYATKSATYAERHRQLTAEFEKATREGRSWVAPGAPPLPWVMMGNGKAGMEGPLQSDVASFQAEAKKYQ